MSGLIKVKIAKVPKGTARSGRGTGGGASAVIRYEAPDDVEFAQRSAYAHHADEADKATMAERAKVADKLSAGASKALDDRFLSNCRERVPNARQVARSIVNENRHYAIPALPSL